MRARAPPYKTEWRIELAKMVDSIIFLMFWNSNIMGFLPDSLRLLYEHYQSITVCGERNSNRYHNRYRYRNTMLLQAEAGCCNARIATQLWFTCFSLNTSIRTTTCTWLLDASHRMHGAYFLNRFTGTRLIWTCCQNTGGLFLIC